MASWSNIATKNAKQLISFVSSSGESSENISKKGSLSKSENISIGKEVSDFYTAIISSPSSNTCCVPSLIKSPVQLNKIKAFENSPEFNSRHTIFYYAQHGNLEGVKYCLAQKCKIDIQDDYGWTALMCAAVQGHYHIVEYLIKNGASLSIKNKQSQTALDIAEKNNYALMQLLKHGIKETTKKETNVKMKYCNLCDLSYKESKLVHESSIVHLFNAKQELSTIYHIPENNKGFQIMLKKGWDKNKGLGSKCEGRKFPIKTILKSDRSCLGGKKEVPRITHNTTIKTFTLNKKLKFTKKEKQKLDIRKKQTEIFFRRQFNDL